MGKFCLIIFGPGFRHVLKLRLNVVLLTSLASLCAIAAVAMAGGSYWSLIETGNSDRLYHLVVENRDLVREKQTMEFQIDRLGVRASDLEKEAARIMAEMEKEGLHIFLGPPRPSNAD